ncbi:hypothetical protein ANCCEY_14253 [Ancylostoma ceylanicum]|uniref:Uncharacterized protein n=2 Tax=Ancylostoma ceylanicum TaxID=53326 RepID=A0A0D6LA93_9BILA|nr:hypothetical protein ANCCEY_14253 [Ancylostoma ceylanicum]EYB94388.1 hypothetical protein Y032_0172g364 [Ancylostoma ceylanicum]
MYTVLTFAALLASTQAFLFGGLPLFGGCNPCGGGYAQSQSYAAPSYSAYSAPSSSYSYQPQAPVYGGYAQAPSYQHASSYQSYSAPQPSYGAPQPSYGASQLSYGAPQPTYGAAQSFAAEQPSFSAQQSYQAPAVHDPVPSVDIGSAPVQPAAGAYAQPAAPVFDAPARPAYNAPQEHVVVKEIVAAPAPPPAPVSYEQPAAPAQTYEASAPVHHNKAVTEVAAPSYSAPAAPAPEASGY